MRAKRGGGETQNTLVGGRVHPSSITQQNTHGLSTNVRGNTSTAAVGEKHSVSHVAYTNRVTLVDREVLCSIQIQEEPNNNQES